MTSLTTCLAYASNVVPRKSASSLKSVKVVPRADLSSGSLKNGALRKMRPRKPSAVRAVGLEKKGRALLDSFLSSGRLSKTRKKKVPAGLVCTSPPEKAGGWG